MELSFYGKDERGLSEQEISSALLEALRVRPCRKALLIPPDFTRLHSGAGFITNFCYHALRSRGCDVDILPALGTHEPMTREQAAVMFEGVPFEALLRHDWRKDVVPLGEVPANYLEEITEGLWHDPIDVEINRRVMDERYDLILSLGQVVPHEVAGMSNHAKNLFVGVGGSDMINKSHMVGAVYGLERMMGRDHSPVRKIFDYALEHYLGSRPILFALTVTTAPRGKICTHGLFLGDTRGVLEKAIALSQEKNIDFVEEGIETCVVYLDPAEYQSAWLGNKAIYRTRMALADRGRLIVLAPGVRRFGEDKEVDRLIRKYGYRGRLHTLEQFRRPENRDLRDNMGAAAHLIHGSSDGRFTITYATRHLTKEEVEGVGFLWAGYDETAARYDPRRLAYGYNTLPDGERVYFIPNPALGLWARRDAF